MPAQRLSTGVSGIEESATIRVANLARSLRAEGKDVISLSLGEPDFDTPEHIKRAAWEAMQQGHTHYTQSAGIPELREEIARKLREENGLDVSSSQVMLTPGAKYAIFEVACALLEGGDEAVLVGPAWVSYEACVRFAHARTTWVNTTIEDGFQPDPDEVAEHVSTSTRLLILNSPCNPTGAVYPKETLKAIAELACDYDFFVLADEIYEKIIYEGEHTSIGSFEGMQERTITVNGFSKAYAMTGWRLGYVAAPEWIIKGMLKLQSHSVSHPTSFVQWAGLAALKGKQDEVERMRAQFEQRRDVLLDGLLDLGIECPKPEGAFYVFANVGKWGTGDDVAERLLKKAYVGITPGGAFGSAYQNYVRISYAASIEKLKEALKRMEAVLL
ncbi:MAG: pyridoxal phosphate-dependent aminotransferase [Methermicoccaceae archaeon]